MKKYLIFAVMFAVAMASAAGKFFEMDKKGNLLFKGIISRADRKARKST